MNHNNVQEYRDQFMVLFNEVRFGRYLRDYSLNQNSSIILEYQKLLNFSEYGNIHIAIDDNENIVGLIGYQQSIWDSDVFEKNVSLIKYFLLNDSITDDVLSIGQELLKIFEKWVFINNIDVAIVKIDTNQSVASLILQSNSYIFYECTTLQSLELNRNMLSIPKIKFGFANENDLLILKDLVLNNTYEKSHFFLDKSFIKNKVNKMYSKWIESAFKNNKKFVVIRDNSLILGLFIYDILDYSKIFNKKFAVWEFALVEKKFRCRGLGKNLFAATIHSCLNQGVNVIDTELVVKNTPSLRIHNKLNFEAISSLYTFHKWFK